MVTLQMIQEAQESLKGIARKTPLENANRVGENIYIKSENRQLTGAFKIRGAYNKIRSLTPEEASHGVIACSAGNHAQGIALSGQQSYRAAATCKISIMTASGDSGCSKPRLMALFSRMTSAEGA